MPSKDSEQDRAALAQEIAEILAAQAGDDVTYHRHAASQIVLCLHVSGWRLVPPSPKDGGPASS